MENRRAWQGPHTAADFSPQAAAGAICDELIITSIPCLPAPLQGAGRARKEGRIGGRYF